MTPMKQQIENPRCSACGDEMELTVVVPPFGSSAYGLKVFTCPKCGRSEDYLVTSPSQAAKAFCCAQGWEERACIH
jgi:transcription elongation factor Elf1